MNSRCRNQIPADERYAVLERIFSCDIIVREVRNYPAVRCAPLYEWTIRRDENDGHAQRVPTPTNMTSSLMGQCIIILCRDTLRVSASAPADDNDGRHRPATGACACIPMEILRDMLRTRAACPYTLDEVPYFTFTRNPSLCAENSGAYMHCIVAMPFEKSPALVTNIGYSNTYLPFGR